MSAQAAWQGFEAELARWADAGRRVEFWWRDDDATAPSGALARLFALAEAHAVPLALAVIPARAEPALFAALPATVDVIQHGTDHANRAAAGGKKTEFPGTEAAAEALARLAQARSRLAALCGGRALPVLAPPWNRLEAALAARLPEAGLRGLSRFGARGARAHPGLAEVNTHVDLIDWRGARGFAGEAAVLAQAVAHLAARRTGAADAGEPTGWLSHHAVHDAASWDFLEALFARTASRPGVQWSSARALFAAPGAA